MIFDKTSIKIYGHEAPLRIYVPDEAPETPYKGNRPAVVILPGGGYSITYAGEAEPIALKLTAAGICAFVLDYATKPSGKVFPQALIEALTAVKFVRDNAEKYGIDAHNIATLGFSAGGHLCSCTGTLWNSDVLDPAFDDGTMSGAREDYRPDKMVLCYPVISADAMYANKGSFYNLFGMSFNDIDKKMLDTVCTDRHVNEQTPKALLWHTAEDTSVPPQNSLLFAKALADSKVPFELYIYPHGQHGLCTGDHVTRNLPFGSDAECAEWTDKTIRFMFDKFGK